MSDSLKLGDVVQLVAPEQAAPAVAAPIEVVPDVRALLAASRSAHKRFQNAAGHNDGKNAIRHPNDDAAALAITDALNARLAAEGADPNHADPAWADDEAANKGVTSDAMTAFFRDYFAPEVPL